MGLEIFLMGVGLGIVLGLFMGLWFMRDIKPSKEVEELCERLRPERSQSLWEEHH